MRISDWSSDVCSSDLERDPGLVPGALARADRLSRRLPDRYARHRNHEPAVPILRAVQGRSEERRVGKECVSTCRFRWATNHEKKKHIENMTRLFDMNTIALNEIHQVSTEK